MPKIEVDHKERKKLKVTWVKPEPEKRGQYFEVLKFNCADNLQYEITQKHLFQYIKVDAELDADTESQIVTFDDGGQVHKWVVTQLYIDNKPLAEPEKKSTLAKRSYGKSQEELELSAKAYSVSYAKDLAVADKIGVVDIIRWAKEFYSFMKVKPLKSYKQEELIIEISQIEEAKGEITKAQTIQETATTGQTKTDVEVVAESPKTIGEFLSHIKGMGIKAPRVWLEKEGYVKSTEILTLPKCLELYKAIQKKEMVK